MPRKKSCPSPPRRILDGVARIFHTPPRGRIPSCGGGGRSAGFVALSSQRFLNRLGRRVSRRQLRRRQWRPCVKARRRRREPRRGIQLRRRKLHRRREWHHRRARPKARWLEQIARCERRKRQPARRRWRRWGRYGRTKGASHQIWGSWAICWQSRHRHGLVSGLAAVTF